MYDAAIGEKLDNAVRFALTDVDFGGLLCKSNDNDTGTSGDSKWDAMAQSDCSGGVGDAAESWPMDTGAEEDCASSSVYDVTAFICHSGGMSFPCFCCKHSVFYACFWPYNSHVARCCLYKLCWIGAFCHCSDATFASCTSESC